MIQIDVLNSEQSINYAARSRHTITDYSVRCLIADRDALDLITASSGTLPPIRIQTDYDLTNLPEFLLSYPRFRTRLSGFEECVVQPPEHGSASFPCDRLPLLLVEEWLKSGEGVEFEFQLSIIEQFDPAELYATGAFNHQVEQGERLGEEVVRLESRAYTLLGGRRKPVKLKQYIQLIGDLEAEIIWSPRVEGLGDNRWHIEIDALSTEFGAREYDQTIQSGLETQANDVLARIPIYLREQYPSTRGQPLTVKVVIAQITPGVPIVIRFRRRSPEGELFFKTNKAHLDSLIINVHKALLGKGVPIGPNAPIYQKVSAFLLKYRDALLNVPLFADFDTLRRHERDFHAHLHSKLSLDLEFGAAEYTEVSVGNGRIDLLINGIPTELKLERETSVTAEIIEPYQNQAAEYVSRCGSPMGFLIVLDATGTQVAPTPPAAQDLVVVDVTTESGSTVTIVGLVMRLPARPSEFST